MTEHARPSFSFVDRVERPNTGRSRPGTGGAGKSAPPPSASFVICSVRSTPSREVGVAIIDTASLHRIELVQFRDGQSFTALLELLHDAAPREILFGKDQTTFGAAAKVAEEFCDTTTETTVLGIARKFYDEAEGEAAAASLAIDGTVAAAVGSRHLALSALAALLRYVEHLQGASFAPRSVLLTAREPAGRVALDAETLRHLEILTPARSGAHGVGTRGGAGSLLGVLNSQTRTALGARLLFSNLRAPVAHIGTLELRYDCVAELLAREGVALALAALLPSLPDLDAVLSTLATRPRIPTPRSARSAVSAILALTALLSALPNIAAAFAGTKNPLFLIISDRLREPSLTRLAFHVGSVLAVDVDDVHKLGAEARSAEVFAVRAGLDGDLDASRRVYTDALAEIRETAATARVRWSLSGLKVSNSSARGFHFLIAKGELEARRPGAGTAELLPPGALQPVWSKASVAVTTSALTSINARLNDALASIFVRAYGVLASSLEHVRGHLPELYKVAESIAMIDMLASFAATARASAKQWARPALTEHGLTRIIGGRHPVLEAQSAAAPGAPPVVENDISLGGDTRLVILTGANASGKSTALRMLGVLVILAQIGSYVPARAADVRVITRIASRLGVGDDLAANASTFFKEMRETTAILDVLASDDATRPTLVLFDELGRGTSSVDGIAIAWAVAEHVALRAPAAQCLFVTHAAELCSLADLLAPLVGLIHTADFSIGRGAAPLCAGYGIAAAATVGLPPELIEDAYRLRTELARRIDAAGGSRTDLVSVGVAERAAAARAAATAVARLLPVALRTLRAADTGGASSLNTAAREVDCIRRELAEELVKAGF